MQTIEELEQIIVEIKKRIESELVRLQTIEAAARKFTKGINTEYDDEHRGDCDAYRAMPPIHDTDCTCGLIELVKALETK